MRNDEWKKGDGVSACDLIHKLRPVLERWPAGMIVWHRADGRRGVVVEHSINGDGFVGVVVSFDPNSGERQCQTLELSAVKITADDEGEGWKTDDGGMEEV